MSDDFEKEIQSIFFQEAFINLEEAEEVYLKLDENSPIDIIERSFRHAHNLKGSAKAVGFNEVSNFLHNIEALLLLIKNKTIVCTKDVGTVLLECNDKLRSIINELKNNSSFIPECSEYINKINNLKTSLAENQGIILSTEKKEEIGAENDIVFFADTNTSQELSEKTAEIKEEKIQSSSEKHETDNNNIALNYVQQKPVQTSAKKQKKDLSAEFLRVPLQKVEKLQNYVGEMVILESMLKEQVKTEQSQLLKNYFRQLDKITKEVQDTVMSLRLIPIKPIFQKLSRTARDTSLSLNKNIEIKFIGEETEIDKFVLDEISDPLMHMVRNSIDHGIETPEERKNKNKPEVGTVTVQATHESGYLVLIINDDGKGLNAKILHEKAEQKGVIKKGLNLTEAECFQLIFAPGFSTKAEATEISGRGVGMDVVKTNIESLNGSISIESEIDKGTHFKIKIPLSIGIMDAFIIEICNEKFVIPIAQIKETINLQNCNIKHVTTLGDVLILRNEEIPIIDLGLGLSVPNYANKNKEQNKERVIMVTQDKEQKVGVLVDKILTIQSVVTKSLGEELRLESGIVGSVILGDGKAVPILETSSLIKNRSFMQNLQRNNNRILL